VRRKYMGHTRTEYLGPVFARDLPSESRPKPPTLTGVRDCSVAHNTLFFVALAMRAASHPGSPEIAKLKHSR
jgi:hypothetical protein